MGPRDGEKRRNAEEGALRVWSGALPRAEVGTLGCGVGDWGSGVVHWQPIISNRRLGP